MIVDIILQKSSLFLKLAKTSSEVDLTEADNFSYSAVMRQIYKNCDDDQVKLFLQIYLDNFNKANLNNLQKPETVALQNTLVEFSKTYPIKIAEDLIKSASVSELGSAEDIGHYLANVVRFIMSKISDESRQKSINGLKGKLLALSPHELSIKDMPNSAAIGQSITFIKNVLFNHDPSFIKQVIQSTVNRL